MEYGICHGCRCVRQVIPGLVRINSIEMTEGCRASGWEWRLKYVGMLGAMMITTITEDKYKGMSRVSFVGELTLSTSPGALLLEENIITLTTKNTVYVFEITDLMPAFLAGIADNTVN